jgi:hypothetical protein
MSNQKDVRNLLFKAMEKVVDGTLGIDQAQAVAGLSREFSASLSSETEIKFTQANTKARLIGHSND